MRAARYLISSLGLAIVLEGCCGRLKERVVQEAVSVRQVAEPSLALLKTCKSAGDAGKEEACDTIKAGLEHIVASMKRLEDEER